MDTQNILALLPIGTYFSIIIGLFIFIMGSLVKNYSASSNVAQKKLYVGLTIASLVHTWFYMLKFIKWSFDQYTNTHQVASTDTLTIITEWLSNTRLFEQAWLLVNINADNRWWSEQICTFTVGAWTVFLATEGWKHKVKHVWAYMLLGQLVAVAVAANLFFLALTVAPPIPKEKETKDYFQRLPLRIWLPVTLAIGSVVLNPYTDKTTFLPNLLVMHALIFIPILPIWNVTPSVFTLSRTLFMWIIALVAFSIHTGSFNDVFMGLQPASLTNFAVHQWSVLHSNPAQASIGWDVIWATISYSAWLLTSPKATIPEELSTTRAKLFIVPTMLFNPIGSAGVVAPIIQT
ncbi:hypothetical protein C8Q75DRAFT_715126 [Abortiporus biennis]|nr:hypothetical protein C8Q75DRAFT_715126 [Abortiporus biennis]